MEKEINAALKDKLIIAGISEIEEHGISDFSLRRVATKCGASCAAPYRHFKNKEDIIREIFGFIDDQWKLMEEEICRVYQSDTGKCLVEICMANILFRIANPGFNAVLNFDEGFFDADKKGKAPIMVRKIRTLSEKLCAENEKSSECAEKLHFALRSYIYGASVMIKSEEFPQDKEILSLIKGKIEEEVKRIKEN